MDVTTLDPQTLSYGAAGLLAATLLLLFGVRRIGRRKAVRTAQGAETASPSKGTKSPKPSRAEKRAAEVEAKAAKTAAATAETPPRKTNVAAQNSAETLAPTPVSVQEPERVKARAHKFEVVKSDPVASAPVAASASSAAPVPVTAALPVAPEPAPEMADLGVYKPHFDFSDSDAFIAAIRDVREAQMALATGAGVILPLQGAEPAQTPVGNSALARLAARAYTTDCDLAIANVRWNTVEQMEARFQKTESSVNATLSAEGARINPDFAALKLKELRLTHEQREKLKEERDLRFELAKVKKQEMMLAKDAAIAEKEEARLTAVLARTRQAAQRATGDEAFELEAQAGHLTRELEAAHSKAETAKALVSNSSSGHVYVLSNVGSFGEGILKIGMTRRPEPNDYFQELSQESVPFPYDVHAVVYAEDAEALRDSLWATFADQRVNKTANGSAAGFFALSLDEVTSELAKHEPKAEFMSAVEAQGYHQTLAQLRAIEHA